MVGGRVKARPQASVEDDFFFSSSDTAPLELSGVFRIVVHLFARPLWLYILLLPSSWPSICRLRRSPLECLSHPALPSTCCELQWAAWHYLGVIPSLMLSDCQLRAFNAKVTGSSTITLSPCSHSCPSMLVPSFGGWRGRLRWMAYCPFFSGHQLPWTRHSSTISPSSCGPSLVILERFPPRLGSWA